MKSCRGEYPPGAQVNLTLQFTVALAVVIYTELRLIGPEFLNRGGHNLGAWAKPSIFSPSVVVMNCLKISSCTDLRLHLTFFTMI